MKNNSAVWYLLLAGFMLTACAEKSFSLWEDDEPVSVQGSGKAQSIASQDELPSLRGEASVPLPDQVAMKAQGVVIDKAFTGKAVSLDTRIYYASAGRVFSSVIDAMTALNIPVQRVDSPTGIITTEWIWKNADSQSIRLTEGRVEAIRHRFNVRVFRLKGSGKTQLEIRTLGQTRIEKNWVNRPLKRKVGEELFSAVEEQLARSAPKKAEQGETIRPVPKKAEQGAIIRH